MLTWLEQQYESRARFRPRNALSWYLAAYPPHSTSILHSIASHPLSQVIEMEHCYFVNDYRQSAVAVVQDAPPRRCDHGLPPGGDGDHGDNGSDALVTARQHDIQSVRQEAAGLHERNDGKDASDAVVLCNFNRLHKIDPRTFSAWMEVT